MRKSFDGLCGLARSMLQADPRGGSWFLFGNRRDGRLKMRWQDCGGATLFCKRLESGALEMIRPDEEAAAMKPDDTDRAMLFNRGLFASVRRRLRY